MEMIIAGLLGMISVLGVSFGYIVFHIYKLIRDLDEDQNTTMGLLLKKKADIGMKLDDIDSEFEILKQKIAVLNNDSYEQNKSLSNLEGKLEDLKIPKNINTTDQDELIKKLRSSGLIDGVYSQPYGS